MENAEKIRNVVKLHKGRDRIYRCPKYKKEGSRDHEGWTFHSYSKIDHCGAVRLSEGHPIPTCVEHEVRFRMLPITAAMRAAEARENAIFVTFRSDVIFFADVAKVSTSRCRICGEKIAKGADRLALDLPERQAIRLMNGAMITRRRFYMHRTCVIDQMFGGKPGKGCPGCTAKVADREFREYKKSILEKMP